MTKREYFAVVVTCCAMFGVPLSLALGIAYDSYLIPMAMDAAICGVMLLKI